jgi:DNA segregation ATPase FtsK/SpoIIIE-like protein
MSDRFERRLARHLGEFFEEYPPEGGQILLAKFTSSTVTERFTRALVEELGTDGPPITVDGRDNHLPVYWSENDVPVYLARVVPDIDEDEEVPEHVVVQGFATKMRNLVAASAETDDPKAMLMVMDTESSLDTLEASEDLFADDGPMNLSSFRDELLDHEGVESTPGKALLRGLDRMIGEDTMYAEDTEVLETLCEIRDAVEAENAEVLPGLIGDLPQFITEDLIGDDWFEQAAEEDVIVDQVVDALSDNADHASTLQRAFQAGTDTASRLESNYDESFAEDMAARGDWSGVTHSTVRRSIRDDGPVRFDHFEVDSSEHTIYSPPGESSKTRYAVRAVAKNGEIGLTAEFLNDIGDTPYECLGPDGEAAVEPTKRENRVTASLDGLAADRAHFVTFRLYVGKKTTQGKPTHQFDIAVLPDWFYQATKGTSLDVDVERESVIVPGDTDLELEAISSLGFEYSEPEEIEIDEEQQIVEFVKPLVLRPNPSDVTERITCTVVPPAQHGAEIPVSVTFLLEASTAETEEVTLPLMLESIVDPERWAGEHFRLPSGIIVDSDRGEIYTTTDEGVRLEDETLELIQIEEHIIAEQSPVRRDVEGDSLDFGVLASDRSDSGIPDTLWTAYDRLFEHFETNGTTPSTDPWGEETKRRVQDVLDAFEQAVSDINATATFDPYIPLRELGTVQSTVAQKVWLTPFHPLLLSYGLRIAEWRDTELAGSATSGFRHQSFSARFNPAGLFPYRTVSSAEQPLRGMRYQENPLWMVYSSMTAPGSVTPTYMERVIRDKLFTFVQAFPVLFSLHPERHLVVNVINMGDLRPVVKGLYEFYRKIEKSSYDPPTILLRIYGGAGEGEALERFFTESAESRLRTQLEKKNDELVDQLRTKIRYVRAGEYKEGRQKRSHLTFFRGLLEEQAGVTEIGDLPSGTLKRGLFPRESIRVDTSGGSTVYTVGFSCQPDENDLIHDIARTVNALEAGVRNNRYRPGQALKKNVKSQQGTDLGKLWDDTLWAVHVQPNVGIDYYLRSDTAVRQDRGSLMIHYSDQYDSSSPNYDVITSTDKRDPYILSLQEALESANLTDVLDPEAILSTLVAIDGELALELQRANDTEIVELIGFVGGLALSRELLRRGTDDHVWVPLSLNELARHDRSYRTGDKGLFQFEGQGKASDDLCFVGIPEDPDDSVLKLWVVETKGGTSSLKTGREQVVGALDNLKEWLQPSTVHADDELLYAEFGTIVLDVARRMRSYGVLDDAVYESVQARERNLLEGTFDTSFITDQKGHVGEVIRVQEDRLISDVSSDGQVRGIEVPLKILGLLTDPDLQTHVKDLDLEGLTFDVQSRAVLSGEASGPGSENKTPRQDSATSTAAQESPVEAREEPSPDDDEIAEPQQTETGRPADSTSEETGATEREADSFSDGSPEGEGQSEPSPADGDRQGERNTTQDEDTEEEPSAPSNGSDTEKDTVDDEDAETAQGATTTGSAPPAASLIQELQESPEPEISLDRGQLASGLKKGFESLGVRVHPPNPSSISVGPRKIGVDVIPKEGQKIEGVLNSLDSLSVHIQAEGNIVGTPVPAKGAVRLEIPHENPRDIYLREGLEAMAGDQSAPLTVPIGVDTENEHHALSLVEERHALIGGATGSGKSNFLSTVIVSLALRNDPTDLTLSLIDPKAVDFGRFRTLPHVSEGGYYDTAEDGAKHLRQILNEEVPKRRERLQQAGVASVAELNEHAEALGVEPMPFHVIVIDEFADLIMSVDDESAFEEVVTRLAQIGRALGIVILLATQRPSADIVSGKIKANFPCRISFRLPSNTDSRVILDESGAEDLHGAGDMIVKSQSGDQYNLQGYFLTPVDSSRVISHFQD